MESGLQSARSALAMQRNLWNLSLVDAEGMHGFAKEKGINIFDGNAIFRLWSLGLLRADCVDAKVSLDVDGLQEVARQGGVTTYCDTRLPAPLGEGYGGAFGNVQSIDATPLFHPYRLYVLHHVERVFRLNVSCTQYLSWTSGIRKIVDTEVEHLDRWTSTGEFCQRFDHWNRVAELAIALEPLASASVAGEVTEREEGAVHRAELAAYRQQVESFVRQLGQLGVREARHELGRTAEWIDENRNLHVLLRLMSGHERRKLRGALGCSMQLLAMAEVIRRVAETALNQQLPEEDQIGLGTWFKGARKLVYGTERVFDAPRRVLRDYLTSMGLDFGTKVRCYVEGLTELAALSSAFGDASGIEFVNLRANVVQRGGKGLSFADSIRSDAAAHVFSVVLIDGDRADYVRVLRQAAEERTFLGRYFVSDPDVEFANFTASELLQIVIELAREEDLCLSVSETALNAILKAKSNGEFRRMIEDELGFNVRKDGSWGRALMRCAIADQTLPPAHQGAGKTRPLIEAAETLTRALRSGYVRSADRPGVAAQTNDVKRRSDLPSKRNESQ
jgi:hypothetical protein